MRGDDEIQDDVFSYISQEQRIPQDHPLRTIRKLVDGVLRELSPEFSKLYAKVGRPSIAPEKLLRALLLQVLYTVRSERQLMEQLEYNLLFRWFVGLSMNDKVWNATVFSKNRDRLLAGRIDELFFERVLVGARELDLLSTEHFTVDGTLVEAWAGHKSFTRKGKRPTAPPDDPGNPTVDFSGKKRSNQTHQSTTDPEARLFRKSNGTESKLCFAGHILMENRNGLAVDVDLTEATGRAEREAALVLAASLPGKHRVTLGGDKAYDVREFRGKAAQRAGDAAHRGEAGELHRHRWSDDTPRWLRPQPTETQTGRGDLRLAEDGRADAEDETPRSGASRLDVPLRDGGLQPGEDPEPAAACRVRQAQSSPGVGSTASPLENEGGTSGARTSTRAFVSSVIVTGRWKLMRNRRSSATC
jgi:transposase